MWDTEREGRGGRMDLLGSGEAPHIPREGAHESSESQPWCADFDLQVVRSKVGGETDQDPKETCQGEAGRVPGPPLPMLTQVYRKRTWTLEGLGSLVIIIVICIISGFGDCFLGSEAVSRIFIVLYGA